MMYKFSIGFFTATNNLSFKLNIDNATEECILAFWQVFGVEFSVEGGVNKIKTESPQKNTPELQERVSKFVDKYKTANPKVNKLKANFAKLEEGEWFLLLPPIELTTNQRYELEMFLLTLNGKQFGYSEKIVEEFFGCVLENYEIINFYLAKNRKIKIGEAYKPGRICRFCKKEQPEVSFSNEAHAISEALGNKKLILNEECDSCNSFFDENIERQFINYHDISRLICNIKNKDNKTPKLKGKNYKAFKDSEAKLNIFLTEKSMQTTEQGAPSKITLKTGEKVALQNLYKALCKFALSVIDSKHIQHFDKTIDWLNGKLQADKLPQVGLLFTNQYIFSEPEIAIYLRNNSDKSIPYAVGEFKFAAYVYVFIIPFASEDNLSFIEANEYQPFLDCFKHYRDAKGFNYLDYSSSDARKLVVNINLEQRENGQQ